MKVNFRIIFLFFCLSSFIQSIQEKGKLTRQISHYNPSQIKKKNLKGKFEPIIETNPLAQSNNAEEEKDWKEIMIEIDKANNPNNLKKIGLGGTFGLVTDFSKEDFFNSDDIETRTEFIGKFKSFNETYDWSCRLWNPKNMNLVLLCTVSDNISKQKDTEFKFEYGFIIYDNYRITLSSKNFYFRLEIYDSILPFLYSEEQIIYLDNEIDSYNIKIKSFSHEIGKILLTQKEEKTSFITFDDCIQSGDEYTCSLTLEKIETVIAGNNIVLTLVQMNEVMGIIGFEFVFGIKVELSKQKKGRNNTEFLLFSKLKEKNDGSIQMNIKESDNKETKTVGKNGILYFKTDYDDSTNNIFNEENLEESFYFQASIMDRNNFTYSITCSFWKPKIGIIGLFCQLRETFKRTSWPYITFDETLIYYKGYNIHILSEAFMLAYQSSYNFPFLYSDQQNIEFEEGKEIYELKFKIFNNLNNYDLLFLADN